MSRDCVTWVLSGSSVAQRDKYETKAEEKGLYRRSIEPCGQHDQEAKLTGDNAWVNGLDGFHRYVIFTAVFCMLVDHLAAAVTGNLALGTRFLEVWLISELTRK
jgi:hypothetical protein